MQNQNAKTTRTVRSPRKGKWILGIIMLLITNTTLNAKTTLQVSAGNHPLLVHGAG